MRSIAVAAALAASTTAWAEGPGSRIRTTPEVQPPPSASVPSTPAQEELRCMRLTGQPKERCLLELRAAPPGRPPSGPESTGMGSGAGSGAGSGTTGGASFGGSAPR
jgi:hypothetical protein